MLLTGCWRGELTGHNGVKGNSWLRLQAVLFDFYDTLVYIDSRISQQKKETILKKAGVEPREFYYIFQKYIPDGWRGRFRDPGERIILVLDELGKTLGKKALEELVTIERKRLFKEVKPYPESEFVLKTVREKKFKLALVSNAARWSEEVFDSLSLAKYFDKVIFSYRIGVIKPEKEIYLYACQQLGVKPEECIFVGDGGCQELDGAHALGMKTVMVQQDLQTRDFGISNYYDWKISNLRDLLLILEKIA